VTGRHQHPGAHQVGPGQLEAARRRAARRRAAGTAVDFDPRRLALARRLVGLPRTKVAEAVGVTAAAVSQYEKGQTKPTVPVVAALSQVLRVPPEFFRAGHPVSQLPASGAHFRSLRSTTALEREQALAFAELALAVVGAIEQYVDLPPVTLPDLDVPPDLTLDDVQVLARRARAELGVSNGPIPHAVRLLEAHGVIVVGLDAPDLTRVDAFCHHHGRRPIILLNPGKQDKARSRFDAAHELGHLIMHHDAEPGSRLVEQQAHAFAAEFLAPTDQIADQLPGHLDWVALQNLKHRWGVSLKAFVYTAHALGRITPHAYQAALRQLAAWGYPEPGELGPPESPVLLPRAIDVLGGDAAVPGVANTAGVPESAVRRVVTAAGGKQSRPVVSLPVG
jgi:Zn-dependent peptidase ImmA (M78 family)/transcriptional regulator with XRE-family HTH domain